MTRVDYDHIGTDYNRHRAAEPSVVSALVSLLALPRGAVIADIGAGTGNYSNALAKSGFRVHAVEPSGQMRSQAMPVAGVTWHEGRAEALPLADHSVQGVVCTLALHHFSSIEKAAREVWRICPGGPLVVLTIDPRLGEPFWFAEFFPEIYQRLLSSFPPVEVVCRRLTPRRGFTIDIARHLLPARAVDVTMHSGWNHPEVYLDETFRQSMSGFALAPPRDVEPGLSALRHALDSGRWDCEHGRQRDRPAIDLGFRFIRLTRNRTVLRRRQQPRRDSECPQRVDFLGHTQAPDKRITWSPLRGCPARRGRRLRSSFSSRPRRRRP